MLKPEGMEVVIAAVINISKFETMTIKEPEKWLRVVKYTYKHFDKKITGDVMKKNTIAMKTIKNMYGLINITKRVFFDD
ncbi:MAG: hypothetical protein H6Q70_1321 [Firmicutes bacterium]|nr:hypothetical protein [Bacillota bacterium]